MERRAQGAAVHDYFVKGSLFRGVVAVLREDNKLAQVEAALPAPTAGLVHTLPTAGAWVEGVRMCELQKAVFDVLGERAAVDVCRRSVAVEIGPISRSITDGIIRLFGSTPEAIFSRINLFDAISGKNVKSSWTGRGEQSGEIRVRYANARNLPDCVALYAVGTMAAVFDIFRMTGTIRFKGWSDDLRNEAVFDVSW